MLKTNCLSKYFQKKGKGPQRMNPSLKKKFKKLKKVYTNRGQQWMTVRNIPGSGPLCPQPWHHKDTSMRVPDIATVVMLIQYNLIV